MLHPRLYVNSVYYATASPEKEKADLKEAIAESRVYRGSSCHFSFFQLSLSRK
jgi:hypothetical protein